jgi:DNA-binding CsgD family transcriptional regulator
VIALSNLAFVQIFVGRPDLALEQVERALEVRARLSGPRTSLASLFTLHAHGAALLALDRIAQARHQFLQGLEIVAAHSNYVGAPAFLSGLGCVAAAIGDPIRCLEFLAAADRCVQMVGGMQALLAMPTAAAERKSRLALQADAAQRAWARGLRMDLRASLQHALTGERLPTNPPLSPRKGEIVRLVAAGLSDKEIAWRMSISVRTVQSHLEQVRGRLGFHNRAQLAVWATSQGLVTGRGNAWPESPDWPANLPNRSRRLSECPTNQ